MNQFINKKYFAIIILIHFIYLCFAFYFGQIYTLDSEEYLYTAKNLLNHGVIYNSIWSDKHIPELFTLRPPLYGIFIFFINLIHNSDFLVIIIQNILSVTLWIFFIIWFNKNYTKKNIELFVIIALIFFPSQMIEVNSIMADLLLEILLFLSFLFLYKFYSSTRSIYIILFNLFLAMALLSKPIMLYFWIPNLLYSIYLYSKNKNIVILISFFLLPSISFFWSLRNAHKTDVFMYSSAKSQNLLDFNAGSVLKFLYGDKESKKIIIDILNSPETKQGYVQKTNFLLDTASTIIKNNKLIYLYCHVKGMFNFMLSTCRMELIEFFPGRPAEVTSLVEEIEKRGFSGFKNYLKTINPIYLGYLFSILIFNILLLISSVSLIANKSINISIRIFISMLILYICFMASPAGYSRFKVCIIPFMLINMPFTIELIHQYIMIFKQKLKNI